jgi:hypothetical protein
VGQALHGHAGMHGPCSRAIKIRWPRAIFSVSPRRGTGGRRIMEEKGQGWPGNSPAMAAARRRGRGGSASSQNGRVASPPSSRLPAAPPPSRRPAAGLDAAALSGEPGEGREQGEAYGATRGGME